jgi:competence protein ComEA
VTGHSVESVIDTTYRPDRRGARARRRLDHLISEAGDDSAPSPDVPWLDVSLDQRRPDAPDPEWWPDVADAPPDTHAEPREPPQPDPPPPRVLLGSPPPTAEPWWRRRLSGMFERWLPPRAAERPRWRLAAAAAVGAVLLGVGVAVLLVMSGSSRTREVPPSLPAAPVGGAKASTGTSAAGPSIVISVVGRVARPGLVTLPEGARVADALDATGGPSRGSHLGGLNLARRLSDGEQIYVGVPAPPTMEPAGTGSSGQPGTGPVDLNSASVAALDTLPGVGPVTAQRILDWRTQHGRFESVDQLRDVDGIGPARFATLKDLVVAR